MSLVVCQSCCQYIDSDLDIGCFIGPYLTLCQNCREEDDDGYLHIERTDDDGPPRECCADVSCWHRQVREDVLPDESESQKSYEEKPLGDRRPQGVFMPTVRVLAPYIEGRQERNHETHLNYFNWALARITEDARNGKFGRISS